MQSSNENPPFEQIGKPECEPSGVFRIRYGSGPVQYSDRLRRRRLPLPLHRRRWGPAAAPRRGRRSASRRCLPDMPRVMLAPSWLVKTFEGGPSVNAMPACLPRSSDFRVLFRVSIGSRRKSSPSSSSRSNAQRTAGAPDWCPRMRSNTASPFWSVTIASPSIKHERADNPATAAATSGKRSAKS
jgi:hypothetical protein